MKIGLIDVDAVSRGKVTFPNLSLMKISAWHKQQGDHVEWYIPGLSDHMNIVYMAKVFGNEYSKDYPFEPDADWVIKGGSGYAISVNQERETYNKIIDYSLPDEVEHIMPDYSIYNITDTAYGFLTRGCPRGCEFCHVKEMQGLKTHTVANLSEFWNGQKYIKLLDPNLTASRDYEMHMTELAESKAYVDFTQGLDARLLTKRKIELLNNVKWKRIHFAWDKPSEDLRPQFTLLKENLKSCNHGRISAYVLTNFNSTHEQDIMRIQFLRSLDIQPYVMIYRKETAPKETRQLQRWCSPFVFWKTPTFEDYKASTHNSEKGRKKNTEGINNGNN